MDHFSSPERTVLCDTLKRRGFIAFVFADRIMLCTHVLACREYTVLNNVYSVSRRRAILPCSIAAGGY